MSYNAKSPLAGFIGLDVVEGVTTEKTKIIDWGWFNL